MENEGGQGSDTQLESKFQHDSGLPSPAWAAPLGRAWRRVARGQGHSWGSQVRQRCSRRTARWILWAWNGVEGWSVPQALPLPGGLSLRPGRCPRLASASGPSPQLQEDERSHRAPTAGGRSEPGAPGIPPHLAALRAPFSRLGAHVPACCMGPCPLSGPLPLLGPDTPPSDGPEVKVRRGPARPWGLVRLLPHSLASVKLPRALAAP